MVKTAYTSVDLFAGCGGLSEGLANAGFKTSLAVELSDIAATTYSLNHPSTTVLIEDIRTITPARLKAHLGEGKVHLLAGCPPCQGFSTVRRLNKAASVRDARNNLVDDFYRIVEGIRPLTVMMENVPGLLKYYRFKSLLSGLRKIGYYVDVKIVNVNQYEVPQSRKRLVLVGSLLGRISVAESVGEVRTVRQAIGHLPTPAVSTDPIHRIVAKHAPAVMERIMLTPKNGGSRSDLPARYKLKCHENPSIGFSDIYGRLAWDKHSSTITGGCLSPSKGRFLHPEQDRVITPREAALLQSFPEHYKFPADLAKQELALMIGNALPPTFSYHQAKHIANHLDEHLLTAA